MNLENLEKELNDMYSAIHDKFPNLEKKDIN